MTRYVLHPGPVVSRNDGQVHHIGVGQLLDLYGVRPTDRYVVAGHGIRPMPGDVDLVPRFDGRYERVHA